MTTKYTLVRHTGYSVGDNIAFEKAVEERGISNSLSIATIAKKGGLIFNNYGEARKSAETYNYPPHNNGIIPSAKGKFVSVKLDDGEEEIFIPA